MWAAVFAAVLLSACSSTKSVPDNAFLLEKVTLKSDTRHFDASVLQPYLKQKPIQNGSQHLTSRYTPIRWLAVTQPSGLTRLSRK